MEGVGVADHREERPLLVGAVEGPARVEDLVSAVLGVGLGEHHQLDVGRVPTQLAEPVDQVVDLVGCERQAELGVGPRQRLAAALQHPDMTHGPGLVVGEDGRELVEGAQHRLGHRVVQRASHRPRLSRVERRRGLHEVGHRAFQSTRAPDARVQGDLGRLRRPRRVGPDPRHHHEELPLALHRVCRAPGLRAVPQQTLEGARLGVRGRGFGDVEARHPHARHSSGRCREALAELGQPEGREGGELAAAGTRHGRPH